MFLFDTNIFLEILLRQNKSEAAIKSLELLNTDQTGVISSFSVHAIEAIISSTGKMDILSDFLTMLNTHPYLNRYDTSLVEEIEIAKLSKKINLDFDDTAQYYIAKKLKLKLVTFDSDFKKIKDIKVVYP